MEKEKAQEKSQNSAEILTSEEKSSLEDDSKKDSNSPKSSPLKPSPLEIPKRRSPSVYYSSGSKRQSIQPGFVMSPPPLPKPSSTSSLVAVMEVLIMSENVF